MAESPQITGKGGLSIGGLVVTFFSIVFYQLGLENIKTIGLIGGGIADVLDGIGSWFVELIVLDFSIGRSAIGGAFGAAGEFLATLGPFAPIASTVIVVALTWFAIRLIQWSSKAIVGAFV